MTCEDPARLIEKYGSRDLSKPEDVFGEIIPKQYSWKEGYIHGDPFEERRVVLDQSLLPFAKKDLIITERGRALKNRFEAELESTFQQPALFNDPVLIMVFCHGDSNGTEGHTGGLCLGTWAGSRQDDDWYRPNQLAALLARYPTVSTSLFMTSCYSGHWVTIPHVNPMRTTVMAGAEHLQETHAWAASASQRHAGGVYTSAFLQELQKEPSSLGSYASEEELRDYRRYTHDVVVLMEKLCVPERIPDFGSRPSFSQEGLDEKFHKRTGFELSRYKYNYDQLRRLPPSDPKPDSDYKQPPGSVTIEEALAWQQRHPELSPMAFTHATGGYGGTRRGLKSSTKYLVTRYLTYNDDETRTAATNIGLMNTIRDFQAGRVHNNTEKLITLRRTLLFRLWVTAKANSYARYLDLQVPPLEVWVKIQKPAPPLTYNDIQATISSYRLFEQPDVEGDWGMGYFRTYRYFAYGLAVTGYTAGDLPNVMAKLNEYIRQKPMTLAKVAGQKREASQVLERMEDIKYNSMNKVSSQEAATANEPTGGRDDGPMASI